MRLLLALLLACPPALAQELGKLADHLESGADYQPPPVLSHLKTRSDALAATYEVMAVQQGCEEPLEDVDPLIPADYHRQRLALRDLPQGCDRARALTRLSRFNKEGQVPLVNASLGNVQGVCAAYCDGPPSSSYGGDYSGSPGYGMGYALGQLMGQAVVGLFGLLAQGISELGKDRPKKPKTAKAAPPPKPKPEPEKPKVKLTLTVEAPEKAELGRTITVVATVRASRSDFSVAGLPLRFEVDGRSVEINTDDAGRAQVPITFVKEEAAPALAEAPEEGGPIKVSAAAGILQQPLPMPSPAELQVAAKAGAAVIVTVAFMPVSAAVAFTVIVGAAVVSSVYVWQQEVEKSREHSSASHASLDEEIRKNQPDESLAETVQADFGQPPNPDDPDPDPARRFADQSKLNDHFERHGADFGARTPSEYVKMATDFFDRARSSRYLRKLDRNGVIRIYDPKTNTFGSYNQSGTVKTFYKPDPRLHKYPTNLDYWNAQRGTPW